jgi:hypothetical protein
MLYILSRPVSIEPVHLHRLSAKSTSTIRNLRLSLTHILIVVISDPLVIYLSRSHIGIPSPWQKLDSSTFLPYSIDYR